MPTPNLDQSQQISILQSALHLSVITPCYYTSERFWVHLILSSIACHFMSLLYFWCKPSFALEGTCFGLCNLTSPTFIHPSHSSTTSFLPHSKCSDEVSCLLIYSMCTFDIWRLQNTQQLQQQLQHVLAPVSSFLSVLQPLSHTAETAEMQTCLHGARYLETHMQMGHGLYVSRRWLYRFVLFEHVYLLSQKTNRSNVFPQCTEKLMTYDAKKEKMNCNIWV